MKTIEQLKEQYPYVVRWGQWAQVTPQRIEEMLRRAEATFAPPGATYEVKRGGELTGTWRVAQESTWPKFRKFMGVE
jgi:hypothetical protein